MTGPAQGRLDAWLHAHASCVGREAAAATIAGLLATHGRCVLVGPTGSGASTLAARVATLSEHPVVRVDGAGCGEPADALRAVGHALGVVPCGDASAVRAALRAAPAALWILDDLDASLLPTVEDLLSAGAPPRVLRVAPRPEDVTDREPIHAVEPLPRARVQGLFPDVDLDALARAGHGRNLLIARACQESRLDLDGLRHRLAGIAWRASFPAGVRGEVPHGVPSCLFLSDGDHVRLRRAAGVLLPPAAPDVATHVLPLLAPWLATTEGAAFPALPQPADVAALRTLRRVARDPETLSRADAARARVIAALGQIALGRQLCAEARGRASGRPERRWLAWAEGDLLLASGSTEEAAACWRDAADAFCEAGDGQAHARMLACAAYRLRQRGEHEAADRLAVVVRALPLIRDMPGDGDAPAARATRAHRTAERALRNLDWPAARVAATEAAALWAGIGEHGAHAAALRLRGDVRGLAGELDAAARDYEDAVRLEVRTRDLHGLVRTLTRAAAVAEALGQGLTARRHHEELRALRDILGTAPG
ncbi:MAG: hypothetical protein RLZZ299_1762 [Pseudomonadota bacterium]